jgi:hypothetical protein|tara:strand:- start:12 stop:548 length:537 start_codon:yes stop_codon:yes gene_type:complete
MNFINKNKMLFLKNLKLDIFPLSLIFVLTFSRLIPHPPNFTPIIAVAVMSGYLFKNIYVSAAVLLLSMFISDLLIGVYSNFFFVYFSLLLIMFFCTKISKNLNFKKLLILSFISALVFFLITNFGVWVFSSMYEKNFNGLLYCYFLAIPFFTNTVISTIVFSCLAYAVNNFYYKKSYN